MKMRLTDAMWAVTSLFVAGTIWLIFLVRTSDGDLKADHWLAFAGSSFGGAMTLLAAAIAWAAVKTQLAEQRHSVELQRRDAANDTLTVMTATVVAYHNHFSDAFSWENARGADPAQELNAMRRSKRVVAIVSSPLLGKDADAASYYFDWAERAVLGKRNGHKFDRVERFRKASDILYLALLENFRERRTRMRLNGIDSLTELRLIDLERVRKMAFGATPWENI